jgi:RNA polymerase sigma-70 factor (ECF subfamily)
MGDKWMDDVLCGNNDRNIRLEKWLNEYGTAVLRICIIFFMDVDMAEKAMQHTFLNVYRHMDRFTEKGPDGGKVFLMRIAIHACRRYRCTGWFCSIVKHVASRHPDLSLAGMAEQKKVLLQAILDLPFRYKEVVLLSHYQDMDIENVGKALHLSKSIVQFRLKTAMEKIRTKLERWYFDE